MRWVLVAWSVVLLLVACAPDAPTAQRPAADGSSTSRDPLPVVVDTDLGADDLLALLVLLRDPAVDVRGIAISGTGLVQCEQGEQNLARLLAVLDRTDVPFGCGREKPGPHGRSFPVEWRRASDAMNGVDLPEVEDPVEDLVARPDAVAVLAQAVSAGPATVLALGPWTNLADLLAADPAALEQVTGILSMAGTIEAPGNLEVAPTTSSDHVEWNAGADSDAFAAVLGSGVPVTLVPLDATRHVPVPEDVLALLGADHEAAGADIAYEMYLRAPALAGPGNYWFDPVAAVALTDPDLLTWEQFTVSVTLDGPAAGRISRDPSGRPVRVATRADGDGVVEATLAGLRRGAPRPGGVVANGSLEVSFDGTTCSLGTPLPTTAGIVSLTLRNSWEGPTGLFVVGVGDGHTWDDVVAHVQSADFTDPGNVPPAWIRQPGGEAPFADGRGDATSLAVLPSGTVGVLCAAGEFPQLRFVDGGTFVLGG
ncbi:nucleoside hydrolase [Nocardioides sp. GCM10030258]|uniref:nucleoside hydrolase n=1 Tax=unclassified Nocardioides TaxID=2615069 RepID=UPI00361022B5